MGRITAHFKVLLVVSSGLLAGCAVDVAESTEAAIATDEVVVGTTPEAPPADDLQTDTEQACADFARDAIALIDDPQAEPALSFVYQPDGSSVIPCSSHDQASITAGFVDWEFADSLAFEPGDLWAVIGCTTTGSIHVQFDEVPDVPDDVYLDCPDNSELQLQFVGTVTLNQNGKWRSLPSNPGAISIVLVNSATEE